MRRAAALALLLLATPPAAAEPAAACSGCHATVPRAGAAIPPIQGRTANEIVEAMLAFRAGTRPATVMDRIAKGYSEEEIRSLAAALSGAK